MTSDERAELKRLAEAATPGPYESHRHLDWQQPQTEVRSKPYDVQILRFARGEPQFWCTTGKKEQEWKNADYLAAASPDVVLELLAERETLKAENERLRTMAEGVAAGLYDAAEYGDSSSFAERARWWAREIRNVLMGLS